jgi:hypothetical protein
VHVVIIGAADHDSAHVVVCLPLGVCIDLLEVGEGLENGLPIVVVFGLVVRPLVLYQRGCLLSIRRVSGHHLC